ncbi:hypothetical protein Uis1B_0226 [Bifidobacterium margollesii]|uniref:DUF805 domain-containing protein n=1 Tax=Bifidobacterium margollesii TaxID=2020964 RepID=A0A2N5JCI2_9BIFI|nr:DUF805 domain-containing protein [Bifidobacterium margollesii]PLS31923.1 hypothetical protein Uis1B_0226 [Bifidobacterium margollesii]
MTDPNGFNGSRKPNDPNSQFSDFGGNSTTDPYGQSYQPPTPQHSPMPQQPGADSSATQQPNPQQPAAQQPTYDGVPVYGQPAYGQPSYDQPQSGAGYTQTGDQGYQNPQYAAPQTDPQYSATPQYPQSENGQSYQNPGQQNFDYSQGNPNGFAPNGGSGSTAPNYGGYGPGYAPNGGEPPLWAPYYGISFPNAIVRFFKKYATFHGRASRSEYWWVVLFTFIVGSAFNILSSATNDSAVVNGLEAIWGLAILIPQLAVAVRRLHDRNKSGWWLLLPYGLCVLAFIAMMAGGVGLLFASNGNGGAGAGAAAILIGAILIIAAVVLNIVMFVGRSDPAGARWDRPDGRQ